MSDEHTQMKHHMIFVTFNFFLAAKDFAKTPEVDADAGETQPGFIQWLTMPSRMARGFYDHFQTSGQCIRPAIRSSPNLKVSLTVSPSPSAVNFGRV